SGWVGAVGLTFEVPWGSSKVFQNTGSLGLDPYITLAKNWRLGGGDGSVNFIGEGGHNFAPDRSRSEVLPGSPALECNIANANKFFPLIELNWFHYTQQGNKTDLGTEGADQFNFGSSTLQGGRDFLTLAGGLRYKCNEHIQLGGAFEFPVTSQKLITDFR